MNKGQSQNESFLQRSASFATHGSRSGANLLGWGESEVLTDTQRREALILAKINICSQLSEVNKQLKTTLPYKVVQEKALLRRELKEKLDGIEAGLSECKKVLPVVLPDMGECIIKLLKERMTRPQWECVIKEALERYKAANGHDYMGNDYK